MSHKVVVDTPEGGVHETQAEVAWRIAAAMVALNAPPLGNLVLTAVRQDGPEGGPRLTTEMAPAPVADPTNLAPSPPEYL